MSKPDRDLHRSVLSYMSRSGWTVASRGVAGELWTHSAASSHAPVAVPFKSNPASTEFQALVDRIARTERRAPEEVLGDVEGEFLDVQSYRISDEYVYDDAARLDTASTILSSAYSLIRAAATTARKPKARIAGNFSKIGDEVASRARLSHTRHGSFVLPVVMPVEPAQASENQLEGESFAIESAERQVTHTLALAVQALQTVVVREEREPNADGIEFLVNSGVSREIVVAVRTIATAPGVAMFNSTFRWSPAVGVPVNVPESVIIPDEAGPLLGKVQERLTAARPEEDAAVSGQIVQITYVPDEPAGSFAIRTERRSRAANVIVHVDEATIHQVYEWAHDHRAVLVRGRIDVAPGRHLEILKPTRVVPIDLLFTEFGDDLKTRSSPAT